jgi:altronate dehydratase
MLRRDEGTGSNNSYGLECNGFIGTALTEKWHDPIDVDAGRIATWRATKATR